MAKKANPDRRHRTGAVDDRVIGSSATVVEDLMNFAGRTRELPNHFHPPAFTERKRDTRQDRGKPGDSGGWCPYPHG